MIDFFLFLVLKFHSPVLTFHCLLTGLTSVRDNLKYFPRPSLNHKPMCAYLNLKSKLIFFFLWCHLLKIMVSNGSACCIAYLILLTNLEDFTHFCYEAHLLFPLFLPAQWRMHILLKKMRYCKIVMEYCSRLWRFMILVVFSAYKNFIFLVEVKEINFQDQWMLSSNLHLKRQILWVHFTPVV